MSWVSHSLPLVIARTCISVTDSVEVVVLFESETGRVTDKWDGADSTVL